MKVIIAGSRTITDREVVRQAVLESGWVGQLTEVWHGGCRGVDSLAHDLFEGVLPIQVFPADWRKHGKAAGPIRNRAMAESADALILVWDGKSKGSKNMRAEMVRLGKPVFEALVIA